MLCSLQILGTEELWAYLKKYRLELDPELTDVVGFHPRRPWQKFVNEENKHLVTSESIDFVDKLLKYDHQERLTAKSAMMHAYFDPVRTYVDH